MLTCPLLARLRQKKGRQLAMTLAFVVSVLLGLAGCKQAHFDGVEYRDQEVRFRLGPIPSGMREIQSDAAKVTLQNDKIGATIAVAGRCGQEADDVPLQALVQHLFLQFQDREIVHEERFTLDGRAALETELTASLDGVLRHFVVVVLKKDGCIYDMYHVDRGGESPELRASREDFRRMAAGFRTLP